MLDAVDALDFNKLEEKLFTIYETNVLNYTESIFNVFDKNGILQKPAFLENSVIAFEEECQMLHKLNIKLRKEIDEKLAGLDEKQTEYKHFKEDHKLFTNKIKETHESLLMARRSYKNCLNFYYTIEKRDKDQQVIFVQFFTESRRDSERYSVRLSKNTTTGKYSLAEINPTLKSHKDVEKILERSNNIPGVLAYIRQAFVSTKKDKN